MKTQSAFVRVISVGAVLAAAWSSGSAIADGTGGVVAVAPRIMDLGHGWTERKIVFAIDPLDQPAEAVNEAASREPSNRSGLLAEVKVGMQREGAVGMGYFGYGFGNLVYGQGRYDLHLSRFLNQRSMEQRWSEYATQSDQASGPEVGDKAIWLPRSAADHDHRLIVRKGLYLARLECTATQERERLVHLARMAVDSISSTTEQDGPANGSQPIRSKTNSTPSAAGSRR